MGRGWGGVMVGQRGINRRPDAVRIAKHFIVPEADPLISFLLQGSRAGRVRFCFILPAIDLDHQLRSMTGEIGDEVSNGHLSPEMPVGEMLSEHSPKLAFSVGHVVAKAASATNCAFRRMTLYLALPAP